MGRGNRAIAIGLGSAIGGASWLTSTSADACSVLSGPSVQTERVPADGVIVASVYCFGLGSCPRPDELTFTLTDPAGASVPGSVRILRGERWPDAHYAAAFVPDHPLVEGATYHAAASPSLASGLSDEDVLVGPPMGDIAPFTSVDYVLTVETRNAGTITCCNEGDVCYETCIGTEQQAVMLIHAGWLAPEIPAFGEAGYATDQFAFRLLDLDGRPFSTEPEHLLQATFEDQAPEYCAQLEAERLRDGRKFLGPAGCVPHGTLPPLESHPTSRAEIETFASPPYCSSPPVGYEGEWCTSARATCDADPNDYCRDQLVTLCTNVPDDEEPRSDSNLKGHSTGSCTVGAAHSSAAGLNAAALLVAGLLRRQRRGRSRTAARPARSPASDLQE